MGDKVVSLWRRAARCTPCGGCFGNDLPVLLLAPLENRYRLAQGLQFLAGLGLGVGSVIAGATLLQEVGKLRGGTLMLAFQRRQLTILARQLAFEGLDPLQCLLQLPRQLQLPPCQCLKQSSSAPSLNGESCD